MPTVIRSLPFALLAVCCAAAAQHDDTELDTYTAVYDVEYKGRRLGESEFSLTRLEAGEYRFQSSTRARGLLRLARPNPAIDRSLFRVDDGRLVPTHFEHEDGSRGGDDNFVLDFDWSTRTATLHGEGGRRELTLDAGTLDRGALQVALMHDLGRGATPGPYTVADDDGLDTYRFEPDGSEPIEVPAGTFDADVLVQQREGSSRVTRLWIAPALSHLPVRIAQFRDGELNTDFRLESVDGLD